MVDVVVNVEVDVVVDVVVQFVVEGEMKWAYDGQLVDAPTGRTCPKCGAPLVSHVRYCPKCLAFVEHVPEQRLCCVVVCAAGDMARVTNELRGVDKWFPVEDLREVQEVHEE